MIGSLLYLTASCLDIMFSVYLCACFQANPKESHLTAVKRIFRYLHRNKDFSIWYPSSSDFDLVGFSDVDYAGYKVVRKNTLRSCQFLGSSFISWHSNKQNLVALSKSQSRLYCSQCVLLINIMDCTTALKYWYQSQGHTN